VIYVANWEFFCTTDEPDSKDRLHQWKDPAASLLHRLTTLRRFFSPFAQLVAMATGARIVPRFEDLTPAKLGRGLSLGGVFF